MKTLSIIVPVYNAASTLEECLKVLRGIKGFEECELIVADDNSADSSVNIAKKYADKIVRNPENKGVAFTRNLGARSAGGEFLLFIDSDVVLLSLNVLSYLKEDLARSDICGAVGLYGEEVAFSNFSSVYKHLYICYGQEKFSRFSSMVSSAILAVSRKDFLKVGGFNESFPGVMAEDVEFTIKLAVETGKPWWLDSRIKGRHVKKYSLYGLFKTNYLRAKGIAKATQKKEYKMSYLKSCVGSLKGSVLTAALAMLMFFLSFFSFKFFWAGAGLFLLFFAVQFRFLKYLNKKRNAVFAFFAVFFSFFEMLYAAGCAFYWQLVFKFKKQ